ncbi:MAG: carbohydrate kinase [Christensenella sp.]
MYDVTAIGEVLIDFTPDGVNAQGMARFARNPGGAPANVLAMNAVLGGKTAFIGKVGADDFGKFLKSVLDESGIDTRALVMDAEVNTTLAFVQLNEQGDRSFSFYRKQGADVMLREDEIDKSTIDDCRIFHYGSLSFTDEPCRSAALAAIDYAKAQGKLMSYDPNYRPFLWESEARAISEMLNALPTADILKVSEEEMLLLTGTADLEEGARILRAGGPRLVLVSRGEFGSFYCAECGTGLVPAFRVEVVDTTGSGDAFLGAVHYRLRDKTAEDLDALTKQELNDILDFANAAGGLTATKRGAIPSMPTADKIEQCRKNIPRNI